MYKTSKLWIFIFPSFWPRNIKPNVINTFTFTASRPQILKEGNTRKKKKKILILVKCVWLSLIIKMKVYPANNLQPTLAHRKSTIKYYLSF